MDTGRYTCGQICGDTKGVSTQNVCERTMGEFVSSVCLPPKPSNSISPLYFSSRPARPKSSKGSWEFLCDDFLLQQSYLLQLQHFTKPSLHSHFPALLLQSFLAAAAPPHLSNSLLPHPSRPFHTSSLIKSALCWDSHIFIQACPSSRPVLFHCNDNLSPKKQNAMVDHRNCSNACTFHLYWI